MTDSVFEGYSFWERLGDYKKPIFLYGTGNGGDKIIAALESYGVSLTGVFASDGFVRDRYYHDFHVRSYSDVVGEYGDDIVVLLAFGTSLPEVREFINTLDRRHELIIPDVPLYGGDLFDMNYFRSHEAEIRSVYELFKDEKSRRLFSDTVNFRLTGKLEYLTSVEDIGVTLSELFRGHKLSGIIDGGAFRGDSTEIFVRYLMPEEIIAVEADPKTYLKLCAYAEQETRSRVVPVNAVLWNECGEVEYSSSASRGSGESGKNKRSRTVPVRSVTIDSLLSGKSTDLIKLDIEGAEAEAIIGAAEAIRRCEPSLAVSLYHRTDDILSLVKSVHESLPKNKLYLRRVDCIPMWDLTLYAVK